MLGLRVKQTRPANFPASKDDGQRNSKRSKLSDVDSDSGRDLDGVQHYMADHTEEDVISAEESNRPTGLEVALPPVETDQDAIDEYESSQAARTEDTSAEDSFNRFNKRNWVRGKSSIYVDAFNVALNTVLDEEEHLFSEAERKLFEYWRDLSYEAQYL